MEFYCKNVFVRFFNVHEKKTHGVLIIYVQIINSQYWNAYKYLLKARYV